MAEYNTADGQQNLGVDTPMSMTFTERITTGSYHKNDFVNLDAAFLLKKTGDTILLNSSNIGNYFRAWRNTGATESIGTDEYDMYIYRTYVKIDAPAVVWKGAGLNLRESVALRFKIASESYDGLRAEISIADRGYTVEAKDFEYRTDGTYIHFRELTAAEMSEPVYITLYRGEEHVSHTVRYSIESYAYAKQNDSSVPYLAELVKVMMAYGDSARAYVESTK